MKTEHVAIAYLEDGSCELVCKVKMISKEDYENAKMQSQLNREVKKQKLEQTIEELYKEIDSLKKEVKLLKGEE